MDPRTISDIAADVRAESLACVARVQALIERARENGARVDQIAGRDFAASVQDAGQDVERALLRAGEAMQEDLDAEATPRRLAARRRDALAYRS